MRIDTVKLKCVFRQRKPGELNFQLEPAHGGSVLPAHSFRQSPGCFILSLGTGSTLKPLLIGCTGCLATRRPIVFGFKMPTSVKHSKYNFFFFPKELGNRLFCLFFPEPESNPCPYIESANSTTGLLGQSPKYNF